jgi:hypothetical protein
VEPPEETATMTENDLVFGAWAFDRCPCCLKLYSFELRRYCSQCAGAACPACAVRAGAEWLCKNCHAGGDAPVPEHRDRLTELRALRTRRRAVEPDDSRRP